MNTKYPMMAGLVLGSAMLVGCPESPEARPAPERTTPTSPTTTTPPRDDMTTTTPRQGGAVDQDVQSRAQTLIQRANQEINAGNFQAARQTLTELELLRDDLSQSMQQQIDDLRQRVENQQQQPGTQPGSSPDDPY